MHMMRSVAAYIFIIANYCVVYFCIVIYSNDWISFIFTCYFYVQGNQGNLLIFPAHNFSSVCLHVSREKKPVWIG